MPELRFEYDKSLVEGVRMTNLVNQVVAEDERKAGQSDTASEKGTEDE